MTVTRPGRDYAELRVDAGADPQVVLRAAIAHGGDVLRFEVADPSLEEVFVERVGAIDNEERTLAAAGGPAMSTLAQRRRRRPSRVPACAVRTRTFVVGTPCCSLGVVRSRSRP